MRDSTSHSLSFCDRADSVSGPISTGKNAPCMYIYVEKLRDSLAGKIYNEAIYLIFTLVLCSTRHIHSLYSREKKNDSNEITYGAEEERVMRVERRVGEGREGERGKGDSWRGGERGGRERGGKEIVGGMEREEGGREGERR